MSKQKTKNKNAAKESKLSWTEHAWEEYLCWQENDPSLVIEINNLLAECRANPFKGTGKPEPLKGDLTGYWSRRITKEHRLVYLPEDGCIYVVQCRFHY
jgi:toxin YoeB